MGKKRDVSLTMIVDNLDFNWVGKDDPLLVGAHVQTHEVTSDTEIKTKFYYTIYVDQQHQNNDPKDKQWLKSVGSPLYDEYDDCVFAMNAQIKKLYIRGEEIGNNI